MMPEPAFRMLHYREFDAAEMSLSWYARTVLAQERPFVAIPVFPSRMFRHSHWRSVMEGAWRGFAGVSSGSGDVAWLLLRCGAVFCAG